MQISRKKYKENSKKKRSGNIGPMMDVAEVDSLAQILKLIDSLYEMRLIERISRPTDFATKHSLVVRYNQKVKEMNRKLEKVLSDLCEKTPLDDTAKDRSLMEEITNKNNESRRKIRLIETRHNEVFEEGSFKHYKKIKILYKIDVNIENVDIEQWARICLEKTNGHSEVCC